MRTERNVLVCPTVFFGLSNVLLDFSNLAPDPNPNHFFMPEPGLDLDPNQKILVPNQNISDPNQNISDPPHCLKNILYSPKSIFHIISGRNYPVVRYYL